ncbi:MAG: hypothetical protein HQL39_16780 [Alphaproteobacteria bacterium]|nr:hypothetical protein [Alphaproteobacteria bacterium]
MSVEGQVIVLSVRPVWAILITAGSKTVELCRKFPKFSGPVTALLYSTGPVKAMVGVVTIDDTVILPPAALWPRVSDRACVTEDQYRAYFCGTEEACALFLGAVRALTKPISLEQLRSSADFVPPMSWRRAKPEEIDLMKALI